MSVENKCKKVFFTRENILFSFSLFLLCIIFTNGTFSKFLFSQAAVNAQIVWVCNITSCTSGALCVPYDFHSLCMINNFFVHIFSQIIIIREKIYNFLQLEKNMLSCVWYGIIRNVMILSFLNFYLFVKKGKKCKIMKRSVFFSIKYLQVTYSVNFVKKCIAKNWQL